jgi:hypothetical protein
MKTIKLILKGILLYTTMIAAMLYICGVDSIYDNGYFIPATGIVALLIYICYKTITEEEADILSGNKLFGGLPDDEL